MDLNWSNDMVDYSQTKVNTLVVREYYFPDDEQPYDYELKFDVDIKYRNLKTDNAKLNRHAEKALIHGVGDRDTSYEERPVEILKKMGVTDADIRVGTVNEAIEDWIKMTSLPKVFAEIDELFGVYIPVTVLTKSLEGRYELSDKQKVKYIEYDYRKPSVDKITVVSEDGENYTFNLSRPISNKDVDKVIPGWTLIGLYRKSEEWLNEDYETTIKLLNKIFGVNLETMKGARIS